MDDLNTIIDKISSSEQMKKAKEFTKKAKTDIIDFGISLSGKINEKINEIRDR